MRNHRAEIQEVDPPAAPDAKRVRAFAKKLIGKTLKEAKRLAAAEGVIVRAAKIDGEPMTVTMDVKMNRVNVAINKGVITSITKIG